MLLIPPAPHVIIKFINLNGGMRMLPILSLILSALVFIAMILGLVLKPAAARRLGAVFMTIAVVGGLIIYGIGYAEALEGSLAMTVIRTPMTVIRMFIGVNDLDTIKNTTPVSTQAGLIVFWAVHLMAFYSMASAAMYTIGAGLLRYLRFVLARHGDLTLIYGINEKSVTLGRECVSAGKTSVVFIAESADEAAVNDLNTAGMSVLTGSAAVRSEKPVIRKLRIRKRKLTVYALDQAEDENLFYALRLKDALEKAGVPAKNTQITLPGAEDILAPMLQVSEERYGFGYVNVFDSADLAARALIRTCPPWRFMHFDAEGRATEDFDCVVAGFGRHGQAALKKLVMNGQFAGSTFHAAVFSPNVENESGFLEADSPELLRQYDIRRIAADARSSMFYDHIRSRLGSLKMIVICTGDEVMNREISDNLMLFLRRNHAERICVVQCDNSGVRYQETVGKPVVRTEICSLDYLSAKEADRLAILLNSTYDNSDRSDWEKWMACDSFGKMSSRASADFLPAFIRISGSSREDILAGTWNPDSALQQVLGQTEHLRWCAFHYAMGYVPMSRMEFEANIEAFSRLQAEGKHPGFRISKNPKERKHACLIPWEELDRLSEEENRATGRNVDYKQIDINNVLALPKLLRAEEDAAKK